MLERHLSPLRYPGGKACLASFLTDVIDLNELRNVAYFEPYAGGAGAALTLLLNGVVSEININDADFRVASLWHSILDETDRFVDRVATVPLDIEHWRKERAICDEPARHSSFEVGFAAFYMNRCNRSGVLSGAGPIGGLEQKGEWNLDARFNRAGLTTRIGLIARKRDRINVTQLDAIEFLKRGLPNGRARRKAFVYLDPPYVNKAERLYLNSYTNKNHREIASYLHGQSLLPWVMSYDDTSLIRELYADDHVFSLPINYSFQAKREASELLICPHRVCLPRASTIRGKTVAIPQSATKL